MKVIFFTTYIFRINDHMLMKSCHMFSRKTHLFCITYITFFSLIPPLHDPFISPVVFAAKTAFRIFNYCINQLITSIQKFILYYALKTKSFFTSFIYFCYIYPIFCTQHNCATNPFLGYNFQWVLLQYLINSIVHATHRSFFLIILQIFHLLVLIYAHIQ